MSSGYHEKGAKDQGLIRWHTAVPENWAEAVLQGPHLGIGTPFAKHPNIPCRSKADYEAWDLTRLADDEVPAANYQRATDRAAFQDAQDVWWGKRYTQYYRVSWRKMIPFSTERSLFAAIIPPGPSHIDGLYSMAASRERETVLVAGFWATLPMDYLLRITTRANLHGVEARLMPAPESNHPLAEALIVRTLRLNCLTRDYADIWAGLYVDEFASENWAAQWEGLASIGATGPDWGHSTPLRSDRARRAALVELDALVAVWLGIDIEELIGFYHARYPILNDYESYMWFDVNGRKIAANHNAYGPGQTKDHYLQLRAYLEDSGTVALPEGYEAPFYKTDREGEYRQAHAVFSERLRQAGDWPANGNRAESNVDDGSQGSAV